jgi:hypothetical protein
LWLDYYKECLRDSTGIFAVKNDEWSDHEAWHALAHADGE